MAQYPFASLLPVRIISVTAAGSGIFLRRREYAVVSEQSVGGTGDFFSDGAAAVCQVIDRACIAAGGFLSGAGIMAAAVSGTGLDGYRTYRSDMDTTDVGGCLYHPAGYVAPAPAAAAGNGAQLLSVSAENSAA